MEAQVLKALAKLRKITTRSHKDLRDVIDAASAAMTAVVEGKGRASTTTASGGLGGGAPEVPFEPFLLACLTRHAKLVAVALDCVEKFLAFGFLRGNGAIPDGIRKRLVQKTAASGSGSKASTQSSSSGDSSSSSGDAALDGAAALHEENWKLIDCIVDVVCDCNDHPDETVQIQVLRVLLTAVTTTTCEVHEHSLLKAVRACYHIHLVSKSATNQTVAKATLQQIISIVFQRMETFDQRVQDETEATLRESLQKSEAATAAGRNQERDSGAAADAELLLAAPTAAWYPSVARVLLLPGDKSAVMSATVTTASTVSHTSSSTNISTSNAPLFAPSFPSVLHKDAFLLFRSLCRISMRSVAEDSALGSSVGLLTAGGGSSGSEDPFAFQSKLLSLELVLSIINNAGPSFRRGERFIHAIRQYLCQSLLQNCTSNYTQIVGLSLQVFLVLLASFKRHLKAELEIFITSIFLRILHSENSSFEHKMLVLEVLNNVCDDAQVLGEIFLNYDCDWNTNDLFKQIIDALAKVAKGKKDGAAHYANLSSALRLRAQQNDAAIVLKGLECMTATVASLKKAANFLEQEKKMMNSTASHATPLDGDDDSSATATSPTLLASGSGSTLAASAVVSTGPSTMSAVEAFDRKKKRQEEFATGVLKFNVKPTAGVQYLIQHGHMGDGSPRDVARFFMEHNSKLDKTMVGDYLGREAQYQGGFCIKVLHEYVDMMDFTGMEIDVAIRVFLAGFRLPGESQKIDRMMEKFAERFYSFCAPGLFPSADTAFILSFSIIMLQTDLHNPSVSEEKKMTKEGFCRNNRGINNGEDLPDEYLGGIFDRIKATPISLKEDEDFKARRRLGGGVKAVAATTLFGASGATVDRQRRDAYIKERESMVRQSEALFKRRNPASMSMSMGGAASIARNGTGSPRALGLPLAGGTQSPPQFHLVTELTETSHVRPMFETVWAPLLACCSVIFESSDAPVAIQLCLNSFKHAIHLAARLHMPAERDAFVTVLAKFTALHNTGSRLLRAKHLEAIKALISISVKEGNHLGDAWRDILQCISQLARVQTHAQGLHSDTQFFHQQQGSPASSTPSSSSSSGFSATPTHSSSNLAKRTHSSASASTFPSPSHRDTLSSSSSSLLTNGGSSGGPGEDHFNPAIEDENAARVLAEIDSLASDRVFSSSVSLTDTAVQEFVLQLCVVSLTECSGVSTGRSSRQDSAFSPPRVFSLQKLVEVADMNMRTRSRVVWASTWKVLSRHFTTIGCHDNLSVAMYAIDSLRQLSMKFLEREELKDFNFQRLFLAPFEVIMANAVTTEIRELVLRCVENLILARVANIKSGWKTIWGVLRVAAETYEPGGNGSSGSSGGSSGIGEDHIVQLGFQIAKRVFEQHFERIVEVFVDAVECLLAFALCGSEAVEKRLPEHIGLTRLSVESIAILQHVCMEKLATGQVIEKLFVETAVPKRVGFRAKKLNAPAPSAGDDTSTSSTVVASPVAGRPPARYERQESSKTLEEEIAVLSPPTTPQHRRSVLSPVASAVAIPPPPPPLVDTIGTVYNDSSAHTRMWWPVLTALSTLAADRRVDVRLAALHGLFDALEAHGRKFSTGLWSLVFKGVLIPLLDELRHLEVFVEQGVRASPKLPLPSASPSRVQYSVGQTTSTFCLERLLECFGLFFDIVGFLPEVLFLLGKCMDTSDVEEELAAAAAASLETMLVAHGHKFPDDVWGLIADELRSVMTRAEPTYILFSLPRTSPAPVSPVPVSPLSQSPLSPTALSSVLASPRVPSIISMYPSVVRALGFAFDKRLPPTVVTESDAVAVTMTTGTSQPPLPSRTHLAVVLALQRVMGNVLASRFQRRLALRDGHVASLTACLRESFLFARKVNDALELRIHLARRGWGYGRSSAASDDLPSLLFQEVEGKAQYVRVLCCLIRAPSAVVDERKRDDARRQLTQLVKLTLDEYLAWTTEAAAGGDSMRPRQVATPVDATQRAVRYADLLASILAELSEFDGPEVRRKSWYSV